MLIWIPPIDPKTRPNREQVFRADKGGPAHFKKYLIADIQTINVWMHQDPCSLCLLS